MYQHEPSKVNQTKQTLCLLATVSLPTIAVFPTNTFKRTKRWANFYYKGKKDYKKNEFFPPKRETECTSNVEK